LGFRFFYRKATLYQPRRDAVASIMASLGEKQDGGYGKAEPAVVQLIVPNPELADGKGRKKQTLSRTQR